MIGCSADRTRTKTSAPHTYAGSPTTQVDDGVYDCQVLLYTGATAVEPRPEQTNRLHEDCVVSEEVGVAQGERCGRAALSLPSLDTHIEYEEEEREEEKVGGAGLLVGNAVDSSEVVCDSDKCVVITSAFMLSAQRFGAASAVSTQGRKTAMFVQC
eukprot:superscaffoldBa00005988_g21008